MTVGNVQGAIQQHESLAQHSPARDYQRRSLKEAKVGQEVQLQVVRKIGDGRFIAVAGDTQYTVDSAVQLTVGQTVRATVSAVGGTVELKYLGAGQYELVDNVARILAEQSADTQRHAALQQLETKYAVKLSPQDRELVAQVANGTQSPDKVAMGAMFLSKLQAPLEDVSLRALYAKQVWSDSQERDSRVAADVTALIRGVQNGNADDIDALAKTLADALQSGTTEAASGAGDHLAQSLTTADGSALAFDTNTTDARNASVGNKSEALQLDELAQQLLNTPDTGAVSYRFGSLPVMVGDQLVELDVLMFRDRQAPDRSQSLRKLVMTLKTESLGRVEIMAQCVDTRLMVTIGTESPQATELLAGHAQEVRSLTERLGWSVDSVSYRLATHPQRAADQLVQHVIGTGNLDAIV